MINRLDEKTAEKYGLNFDELIDDFFEDSYKSNISNGSYYIQSIVKINKESYPDVNKELYGFWESNEYIYDDSIGFDKEEIHTLYRVVQSEKLVITKYWEKVK